MKLPPWPPGHTLPTTSFWVLSAGFGTAKQAMRNFYPVKTTVTTFKYVGGGPDREATEVV